MGDGVRWVLEGWCSSVAEDCSVRGEMVDLHHQDEDRLSEEEPRSGLYSTWKTIS